MARLAARQHGVISRQQLLDAGLGRRAIGRRAEAGRLRCIHRCVYVFGWRELSWKGKSMAAVLACGEGAVLSHRSAAALWGLARFAAGPIDVTAARGRRRLGITVHEGSLVGVELTRIAAIPVTSLARTLFDLAEVLDEEQLRNAFEEADRMRLLRVRELEAVCERGHGRKALRPVRRLLEDLRYPADTQSPLEDRVLDLCREYDIPHPVTGAVVLGREVDAFWPDQKLMVEADSWEYHGNRAAFERDRERDATMQVEGYRVIRLTHRRLDGEPATVANQIRRMLSSDRGDGRATG